jgi:hypothetical protein
LRLLAVLGHVFGPTATYELQKNCRRIAEELQKKSGKDQRSLSPENPLQRTHRKATMTAVSTNALRSSRSYYICDRDQNHTAMVIFRTQDVIEP